MPGNDVRLRHRPHVGAGRTNLGAPSPSGHCSQDQDDSLTGHPAA